MHPVIQIHLLRGKKAFFLDQFIDLPRHFIPTHLYIYTVALAKPDALGIIIFTAV